MYSTRTRVHARIPNGHPREEKRASDKSPRTSRRAERAPRATAGRLPRRALTSAARRTRLFPSKDPRTEVCIGPVEFKL